MRSWGSALQGRPEGEKTGSQLGQPRTQARLRRCPARGVASVLTTDVGHPATSPVLVAVRSLTQQAPGACPMPAEQHGVEGSVNTAEREREALTDVKETKENVTGQRDLCSLLVLEARLRAGPGGPSTARRLEKRSRNTC